MLLNFHVTFRSFISFVDVIAQAQITGGIFANLIGFAMFLLAIGYFLFTGPLFGKNIKKINEHE